MAVKTTAGPEGVNQSTPKITNHKSKILLAWCVHLYTAIGLLVSAGIAVLIVRGGADSFRWAFVLMLVATIIDATDGTFARLIRTREVLPMFDGRRLDDLVDFLTYCCLPLLLLWRAAIPSPDTVWVLTIPLLASAYGFCQVAIKTDDGYFLGFPSCWNVVAFYLYVLQLPAWISLGILLIFSLLTFIPSRYLYPSQPGWINRLTILLATIWCCFLGYLLYEMPDDASRLTTTTYGIAFLSLFFPAYYMLMSWGLSFYHRPKKTL
jgi:phosphatidylcholine synthase